MRARIAGAAAAVVLTACGSVASSRPAMTPTPTSSPPAVTSLATSVPTLPPRAAAPSVPPVHCHVRGPLPDPVCTPGLTDPALTQERLCAPGFSTSTVRDVPEVEKRAAFAEYGLSYPQPAGTEEADHLIPLTIGGSNALANIWPEAASPLPGFHEKDRLEVRLHLLVCSGQMALAEAQQSVSADWVSAYRQWVTP